MYIELNQITLKVCLFSFTHTHTNWAHDVAKKLFSFVWHLMPFWIDIWSNKVCCTWTNPWLRLKTSKQSTSAFYRWISNDLRNSLWKKWNFDSIMIDIEKLFWDMLKDVESSVRQFPIQKRQLFRVFLRRGSSIGVYTWACLRRG